MATPFECTISQWTTCVNNFRCLTDEQQAVVQAYLWATIAGYTGTAQELLADYDWPTSRDPHEIVCALTCLIADMAGDTSSAEELWLAAQAKGYNKIPKEKLALVSVAGACLNWTDVD